MEADTVVQSTVLLSQSNAPAGLGSISHTTAGNTSYVFDSTAGKDIVAYVVDTGILTTHSVSCPGSKYSSIADFAGIPRSCRMGRKYGEHSRKYCSISSDPLADHPEHRRERTWKSCLRDHCRCNVWSCQICKFGCCKSPGLGTVLERLQA